MEHTQGSRTAVLVGAMLIAFPFSSWGAEWSFEPAFSTRAEYNDNLTLTTLPHSAVWGYWLMPDLKVQGAIENMEIRTGSSISFVSYFGDRDVSFTNLAFPILVRHRTEYDIVTVDGSYVRDNTLIGELQQTGVVLGFTQRNRLALNPTWSHALTETLSFQSGYQFNDVSYENGMRFNLFDYQVHGGNAGLSYTLTERDTVQGMAHYVSFTVPRANLQSAYYGLQLSATHAFSESLSGTISGGVRFITSESSATVPSITDRATVGLFSAMGEKKFEKGLMRFEAAREINPSGLGLLLQTDRASFHIEKNLTERVNAAFNANAYWVQSIATRESVGSFPDSQFYRLEPRLSYRMTDQWIISASYSYSSRNIDTPGQNQRGSANASYVMLTFRPAKLSVSR